MQIIHIKTWNILKILFNLIDQISSIIEKNIFKK
jgi:hypothetical protein